MGWKKVAWVSCLTPALAGCNIFYYSAVNALNEPIELCEQVTRSHHLRKQARAAWAEVRAQYPRKAFTAEFRDGFIDGYADYLDRGGMGGPPVVPPKRYTRNDYLNPEGHHLVKDYILGFKYGTDVAIATGQRQFLVVPALLPVIDPGPPAFNVVNPPAPDRPATGTEGDSGAAPLHTPRPVGPGPVGPPPVGPPPVGPPGAPPAPGAPGGTPGARAVPRVAPPTTTSNDSPPPAAGPPAVPPTSATDPQGSKFGLGLPGPRSAAVPDPDPIPAPNPPLPVPGLPAGPGTAADPLDLPGLPGAGDAPVGFRIKLPEPPAEVPSIPDHLPTPSVLDELPVLPANHAVPPPLPANHAVPPRR
jgi:hypothetical protein